MLDYFHIKWTASFAQVSGEYTKVGYFDFTEEFKSAVENNPVVEGWGNKLVFIQPGDCSANYMKRDGFYERQ